MNNYEALSPWGRFQILIWVVALGAATNIAASVVGRSFFSGFISSDLALLGNFVGSALDLAKLSLAPIVLVSLWRGSANEIKSLKIIAFGLLLMSIVFNYIFMSGAIDSQIAEKVKSEQSSSLISEQIAVLDRQIESQIGTLERYQNQYNSNTEDSYKKYNREMEPTINAAEARLSELTDRRFELIKKKSESAPANEDVSLYGMNRPALNLVIALIAIFIDVTSIAGFAFLRYDLIRRRELKAYEADVKRKERIRSSFYAPAAAPAPAPSPSTNDNVQSLPVQQEVPTSTVEIKEGDEDIVDLAIDLIFNQGVKPSGTEIWNKGKDRGMSAKKAKKALGILFDRGILAKNESGHFIVSDNASQLLAS